MHLDQAIQISDSLRGTYIRRHSHDSLRDLMLPLLTEYRARHIDRSHQQVWWRARPCEGSKRFGNLHELVYPPSNLTRWNRANTPQQQTLYASWNIATALDEVGAKPGDLVQLIALRVRTPIEIICAVVGDYQSVNNSGGSLINSRTLEREISSELQNHSAEAVDLQLFLDSFFAELLRRQPKKPEDYLPSTILAEHLLAKCQGLIFPSVETAHSMNLAVRATSFNQSFEVVNTILLRIDKCHGYGIYAAPLLAHTTTFSADGSIDWNSSKETPHRFSFERGHQFDPNLQGWRVPVAA